MEQQISSLYAGLSLKYDSKGTNNTLNSINKDLSSINNHVSSSVKNIGTAVKGFLALEMVRFVGTAIKSTEDAIVNSFKESMGYLDGLQTKAEGLKMTVNEVIDTELLATHADINKERFSKMLMEAQTTKAKAFSGEDVTSNGAKALNIIKEKETMAGRELPENMVDFARVLMQYINKIENTADRRVVIKEIFGARGSDDYQGLENINNVYNSAVYQKDKKDPRLHFTEEQLAKGSSGDINIQLAGMRSQIAKSKIAINNVPEVESIIDSKEEKEIAWLKTKSKASGGLKVINELSKDLAVQVGGYIDNPLGQLKNDGVDSLNTLVGIAKDIANSFTSSNKKVQNTEAK